MNSVGSPEGDGEVIATAIQCFLNLGLEDFLIEIGQVEFFKGLVEDAGLNPEEAEQLRLLIEEKNQLMLEMFLKEFPMDKKLKGILMDLPSMYGDVDVLERGRSTKNPGVKGKCIRHTESAAGLRNSSPSTWHAVQP